MFITTQPLKRLISLTRISNLDKFISCLFFAHVGRLPDLGGSDSLFVEVQVGSQTWGVT